MLGEDAGAVRLVSAGTQAVVGSAMHPDSALVLRGYGAEPGDFRARQLVDADAGGGRPHADHDPRPPARRARAGPRALARTFTLREAAALLALVGDDVEPAGEDLGERARDLVKALAEARSRRATDADDVPDPIGRPLEAHEEAGELIVAALLPILARIAALACGTRRGAEPDPR